VGAKFGVMIVRLGGKNYEVATFRKDLGYKDGRHPRAVKFATPEQDAERRDFTINGMFYDPVRKKILDFVGGFQDLNLGIIRAIGKPEDRFAEDKLRMLRAVRFSARFEFPIERHTICAIKKHAAEVCEVSAERIREELVMIFTQKNPGLGLALLDTSGLLKAVLPEVSAMKGVDQPAQFHPEGDVFTHTRIMLDLMQDPSPELAFAVLLHDIGKPGTFKVAERIRFDGHASLGAEMAHKILRRLRFSNRQTQTISSLVKEHLRFIDAPNMKQSTLKRFLRLPDFDLHLELHRLDCLASHQDLSTYEYVKKALRRFKAEEKKLKSKPRRLLTGDDLIALGLAPGPAFKDILLAVEDAQLDGNIKTKSQALRLANKLSKKLSQ
jgi:tRNA nucleotidyltransferase (CCA-adding enzyme)